MLYSLSLFITVNSPARARSGQVCLTETVSVRPRSTYPGWCDPEAPTARRANELAKRRVICNAKVVKMPSCSSVTVQTPTAGIPLHAGRDRRVPGEEQQSSELHV